MRRCLYLCIILSLSLIMVSCGSNYENSPMALESTKTLEENNIDYTVDQIVLSKGFQSIDPKVEILKRSSLIKLLVSLGALESSGVNIHRVSKKGNEVNIYIDNEVVESKSQLAVPQIILEIPASELSNLDEIKFNIVNLNYKPLDIKLGLNDALNKIHSQFKISPNGIPNVNLNYKEDNLYWDISYFNIFDRDNADVPLINLSAQIDASTGNILTSTKNYISKSIDEGNILSYIPNKYLLYKRVDKDEENNSSLEGLWIYDLINNEKKLLYSTTARINTACFSKDYNHISIIESKDDFFDLSIITKGDKRIYKVPFENKVNPSLSSWADESNLYIVDNTQENSTIYKYNVEENSTELINTVQRNIVNLQIEDNIFIVTESQEDKTNNKISYTDNWKNFRFKDFGVHARFLDKDRIVYLKNHPEENENSLHIYNLYTNKYHEILDRNIVNYHISSSETIVFIEKIGNNDYSLKRYNVKNKNIATLAKINGPKAYFNSEKNLVYLDLTLPFENKKSELIYSIDISKLHQ